MTETTDVASAQEVIDYLKKGDALKDYHGPLFPSVFTPESADKKRIIAGLQKWFINPELEIAGKPPLTVDGRYGDETSTALSEMADKYDIGWLGGKFNRGSEVDAKWIPALERIHENNLAKAQALAAEVTRTDDGITCSPDATSSALLPIPVVKLCGTETQR